MTMLYFLASWWQSWSVIGLSKHSITLRQISAASPPDRSAWCFRLLQTLQTPSMVLSRGCRKQRAWLQTAKDRLVYCTGSCALCSCDSWKHSLQVSWKQTMFTPHMAATSTISPIRLCMALICTWFTPVAFKLNQSVCMWCSVSDMWLSPYLVQDGGVSGQNDVVLNESHTDPSGRPQLFQRSVEFVTLQFKFTFRGSFHSTCREVQLPVNRKHDTLIHSAFRAFKSEERRKTLDGCKFCHISRYLFVAQYKVLEQ